MTTRPIFTLPQPARSPQPERQPNETWEAWAMRSLANTIYEMDLEPEVWEAVFGQPWPGHGYLAALAAGKERMIKDLNAMWTARKARADSRYVDSRSTDAVLVAHINGADMGGWADDDREAFEAAVRLEAARGFGCEPHEVEPITISSVGDWITRGSYIAVDGVIIGRVTGFSRGTAKE